VGRPASVHVTCPGKQGTFRHDLRLRLTLHSRRLHCSPAPLYCRPRPRRLTCGRRSHRPPAARAVLPRKGTPLAEDPITRRQTARFSNSIFDVVVGLRILL